jgi:hypothetical protein
MWNDAFAAATDPPYPTPVDAMGVLEAEPAGFVAVTTLVKRYPSSAAATTYVCAVAPGMSVQLYVRYRQRCHR